MPGLPTDPACERSVLGILLFGGNELIAYLPRCNPNLFFEERNQVIFTAIRRLYMENKGVDLITVRDELVRAKKMEIVGEADYVAALMDGIPRGHKPLAELEVLRNLAERRDCMRLAARIQIDAADLDMENVPEKASERFQDIGRRVDENIKDCKEVMEETIQAIENIQTSGSTLAGVTSGLSFLDDFIGGFPRSALTIVAARPSIGKSAFCINSAMRAAFKGKKVAIFSLEDTRISTAKRMLCALARVDGSRVMKGTMRKAEWGRIIEAKTELSQTNLFFNDRPQTIEEICNGARRIKHEHGLDVLIVDYLQLILGDSRESRNVTVAYWTRSLKMLAQELEIALLLVSQLNRAPEAAGRLPRLADLRESGAIEQDADLVALMHRDFKKEKEANLTFFEPRPVILNIAKNRNGPIGTFEETLNFIPAYTLFFESA